MVFYAAKIMRDQRWRTRRWSSSPTATTWTTSCSARCSPLRAILPEKPGSGAKPRRICVELLDGCRAASCSRRSRSSRREETRRRQPGADGPTQRGRRSPTRRTARSTALRDLIRRRSGRPAKHMRDALPDATYLGFTGTPIETTDKSTRAVFGDYIDVYDLTRAVEDGATVKIFYESAARQGRVCRLDARGSSTTGVDEITEKVEEADAPAGRRRGGRGWKRSSAPRSASTWSQPTSSSTGRSAARALDRQGHDRRA